MLHTIVTLEVQLLIKDIVDEACLQAAERPVSDFSLALSSLKVSREVNTLQIARYELKQNMEGGAEG